MPGGLHGHESMNDEQKHAVTNLITKIMDFRHSLLNKLGGVDDGHLDGVADETVLLGHAVEKLVPGAADLDGIGDPAEIDDDADFISVVDAGIPPGRGLCQGLRQKIDRLINNARSKRRKIRFERHIFCVRSGGRRTAGKSEELRRKE
jgi:hypothetical protein